MGVDLATYRARIGGLYHRLVNAALSTGPVLTGWVIFWILVGTLLLISGLDPNPVITACVVAITVFWVVQSNRHLPHSSGVERKVKRLYTKALQKSVDLKQLPKQQKIKLQKVVECDTSFGKYLQELNVDTLSKHLLDFGRNQQVVSKLEEFLRFVERRIIEQLDNSVHLVKVGSCIDGSKVQQIDEVDTLAIIDTDIRVEKHPHKKNRYLLFNNKDEEIKALELIERLANVIDHVGRTWTSLGNLKHGGFASPHFCGVRYNGPAVTLSFTYEPKPGKTTDLSVDVTLAFRVPAGYPDRQQVVERLSRIQTTLNDRLVEKEEIHFVPDVVQETWLMSTSQIEADLFRGLSKDYVPVKRAFCLTKLISNTIKQNNAENHEGTCFPEDPHVSGILDAWKETSNTRSGEFSDIKKLMRYAHSFLSPEEARNHHECEKHDISMNTAALKHTLLAKAVENTELFRPSQNVDDDVYILVKETFKMFGLPGKMNVPHALIDKCNIGMFSVSKPALLSDKTDRLVSMMKAKCEAVHSKLCKQSTESSEDLQVDLQTGAIEIMKKYLVPTEDILQACAANYIYHVPVDPSVSPKRSREVKHITMMSNGLQNSCGGIIAISCDSNFNTDTQREWWDMFIKGVPSGVEYLDTIEFRIRGTLLGTRCIKPSKLTKSLVSRTNYRVEFTLRDDGWFDRRVTPSSRSKHALPVSKRDNSKTDDGDKKAINSDVPQTDKMLPGVQRPIPLPEETELRPDVSMSYKKDRVLKPRKKRCGLSLEIVQCLSIFQLGSPAHYSPPKEALSDYGVAVGEILNHIEQFTEQSACVLVFTDILNCLDEVQNSYQTAPTLVSSIPKPILDAIYFDEDCHIVFNSIYGEETNYVRCHKRTFHAGRVLSKYMTDSFKKQQSGHAEVILKIYPCTYVLGTAKLPSFQVMPCGVPMPCIRMSLATLLLHDNTTYRDRINNELSIQLTSQQLDKVFGIEMVRLGIIEGPPGSGKTLLEQHLCRKFGKETSIVFCPNKGVAAYINHHQVAHAKWIKQINDVVRTIETTGNDLVYIIIDDVQYIEYDDSAWRQLLRISHASERHLYLFMDSKYQTHRGDKNIQSIRTLVANTKEGCIMPPLREIYRNSQVVVDYMEKTAFGDDGADKFECCSPLEGDDVKVTGVNFLNGKSTQNGLVRHVNKLLASKHYAPTDVAILFEPHSYLQPQIEDIFSKFAPRIHVQKADEYPIRGLIIDDLTRFEGLEAVCLIMVLEYQRNLNNSKFKTMIASRGVKRVEFVQGEAINVQMMKMLHFNPQTMTDEEILRQKEVTMEKELTEDDDEVLHACRNGDLNFMQTAQIDGGAVDHIRSMRTQITLLMTAAYWGHEEIVRWLLHKGASVNANDGEGYTALSCASGEGHPDVVRELLEHGADVEQGAEKPLIEAAGSGKIEVVRMLIEKGASMNIEDFNGYTPLSRASGEGHTDVALELMKHGADVEQGRRKPLIEAAGRGNLEVVRVLIEKGASVDAEDVEGYTALSRASGEGQADVVRGLLQHGADVEQGRRKPLIEAAKSGELEVVGMLTEKGADVNVVGADGNTAPIWANREGHINIVRFLEDREADVNVVGADGNTALIWAGHGGHTDIVRLLLEREADVSVVSADGNTALIWASHGGHTDIVRLLVERGADPNLVGAGSDTALIWASHKGHTDIVRLLVEIADANVVGAGGYTALISASVFGHTDLVQLLLEKGAGVNVVGADGNTALIEASPFDRTDIVRLLIQKGADVNVVGVDGNTALIEASRGGRTDAVHLLLESGADVNVVNAGGNTALSWASRRDHTDVVRLLLEKGADLDVVTAGNNKALIGACHECSTETVALLLEKGADVNFVDDDGHTALISATSKDDIDIVCLLIQKGADVNIVGAGGNTALISASRLGNTDIVSLLLEKGADVNVVAADGYTALMRASHKGYSDTVRLLLEKGPDVNVVAADGDTALIRASHKGNTDTVRLLLEKGADVNFVGAGRNTALISASHEGHTDIVDLLLEKGADVNFVDARSNTALILAIDKGHTDIVRLLLQEGGDVNVVRCRGKTALIKAILLGHTDIVSLLLEKGADVNILGVGGDTALIRASRMGRTDIVGLLVDKGASVNSRDNKGHTALWHVLAGLERMKNSDGSREGNWRQKLQATNELLLEWGATV